MKPMAKDPTEARELTRSERAAIRRLVVGMPRLYALLEKCWKTSKNYKEKQK